MVYRSRLLTVCGTWQLHHTSSQSWSTGLASPWWYLSLRCLLTSCCCRECCYCDCMATATSYNFWYIYIYIRASIRVIRASIYIYYIYIKSPDTTLKVRCIFSSKVSAQKSAPVVGVQSRVTPPSKNIAESKPFLVSAALFRPLKQSLSGLLMLYPTEKMPAAWAEKLVRSPLLLSTVWLPAASSCFGGPSKPLCLQERINIQKTASVVRPKCCANSYDGVNAIISMHRVPRCGGEVNFRRSTPLPIMSMGLTLHPPSYNMSMYGADFVPPSRCASLSILS